MNKQILTDIVNSILGLSKRKKKEFIELLDDGINGVSEQLNETVEQVDQKINNIEPSDFEENDETKSSFIKNRPFYDYNTYEGEPKRKQIDYPQDYFYSSGVYSSNKEIVLRVDKENDIKLGYANTNGFLSTTIYDNTRYKIDKTKKFHIADKDVYKIVNYFNNSSIYLTTKPLSSNYYSEYKTITDIYAYYDGEEVIENLKIGCVIENVYQVGIVLAVYPVNVYGAIVSPMHSDCLRTLIYYENPEVVNYFKSLDEKYIPDTIKNRITALEQAVIALGGTLNT